ncbi:MAG: hypothetical protein AB1813_14385 [Verrucomicrobiota bacterium]
MRRKAVLTLARSNGVTWLLAGWLAFALQTFAQSTSFTSGPTLQGTLERVTIPLYFENQIQSTASVRTEKILTEQQRRGFFRIALLPKTVAENVEINCRAPQDMHQALRALRPLLDPKSSQVIELRQLRWHVEQAERVRLEVAQARLQENGEWQLTGRIELQMGDQQWNASRGALSITGESAGKLRLHTAQGLKTFDLLSQPAKTKTNEPL